MEPSLTIAKSIGAEIVRSRHSHKITQQNLADLVGLSVQQIQKYEYGETNISIVRLLKIAEVFNVCIYNLLKPALQKHYKVQNVQHMIYNNSLDLELAKKMVKLTPEKKQMLLEFLSN